MCLHLCTCTHVHTYMYIHTYIHTYIHVYVYIRMYIHGQDRFSARLSAFSYMYTKYTSKPTHTYRHNLRSMYMYMYSSLQAHRHPDIMWASWLESIPKSWYITLAYVIRTCMYMRILQWAKERKQKKRDNFINIQKCVSHLHMYTWVQSWK